MTNMLKEPISFTPWNHSTITNINKLNNTELSLDSVKRKRKKKMKKHRLQKRRKLEKKNKK
jgi:hypothetical protein